MCTLQFYMNIVYPVHRYRSYTALLIATANHKSTSNDCPAGGSEDEPANPQQYSA